MKSSVHRLLDETTRGILTRNLTRDAADALALWADLSIAGLTTVGLPEDLGGAGGDFRDAAVVIGAVAAFAEAIPIAETLGLAHWVCREARLPSPEGRLTVVPGLEATKSEGEGPWILSGTASAIPFASACDAIVAVASMPREDEALVTILEPSDLEIRTRRNVADEPRDDVRVTAIPVDSDRSVSTPHSIFLKLRRQSSLVRSVQMSNALLEVLRRTVRYAQERVQFGRSLGSFQAVQQMVASLAAEVAAVSAVVSYAIEGTDDIGIDAVAAKVRANSAATVGAALAHQIHGAMGFTREHQLHRLTRRLWAWRDEFNGEAADSLAVGQFVTATGADQLWEQLTGEVDRSDPTGSRSSL